MAVEAQIKLQADRIAKGRQNAQDDWTGSGFWALVDAAANEAYENRVKGSDMSALDSALMQASLWSHSTLRKWFTLHNDYFSGDLALASPYFDSYLTTKGWRVAYEFAEALVEALGTGSRLATHHVFPKGTRPADLADPSTSGMHLFGTLTGASTYASSAGALDTTKIVGAPVLIVNREATPGASSLIMRGVTQAGANEDISITLAGASQYQQTVMGAQAIGSAAAAGQAVVAVAATAQFAATEYVLLWESDSLQEIVKITSIIANTSLTMTTNLINSYTTAGFVFPLFTNVAYVSGSITGGKHLDFYAYPDRAIAL